MDVGNFKFHRRARAAFNQLDGDEQERVQGALASLATLPPDRWPTAQVKRLPGDKAFLVVRIDDQWRAIVQTAEGETPEVMDLVRQDTLDAFAKLAVPTGT